MSEGPATSRAKGGAEIVFAFLALYGLLRELVALSDQSTLSGRNNATRRQHQKKKVGGRQVPVSFRALLSPVTGDEGWGK